jgi:ParB/RepB/Spo0J family partition protein
MAMAKIEEREFQHIPVERIEIGPGQARTTKLEVDIEDLAESIKRFGLIHPITVCPRGDKFETVVGQRRLLAVRRLGWETIPAMVLPSALDLVEAKALSFSENFLRRDLSTAEKRNACIIFHRRYGSMKAASDILGLPYPKVREYVKYDTLHDELKKMVDEGTIKVDEASKAQDISELPDGTIDLEGAKRAAIELKTFTSDQKDYLKEVDREQPSLSVDEKLEEARKPRRTRKYSIIIAMTEAEALEKAAADRGMSEEETIVSFIHEGLSRGGYV